ncbi:unnamed protein product [Knipowitschia caucasica]
MESSSSEEDFVLLSVLEKRKKRKRRYWVHPILRSRAERGEYHLLTDLRGYPDRFKSTFRMSVAQFDALLTTLAPHIRKKTTNFRDPIGPEQRLAVCLRYLCTGDSFTTIANSCRLGITTVGKIVRETCDQIWRQSQPVYLPTPTADTWKTTAKRFNEKWNFPNCFGALDGKHVQIEAPANSGSLFYNYKGTFSIVLLALVDADYRFLAIDVGSYGGNSDGGIFADSALGRALQRGTLHVPPPAELPSAPELGKVNHVIVADEAFPMKPYLLRPYPGRRLEEDKRIFNLRLSRARRISENVFGIMVQRFRVYKKPMEVNPDLVDSVVKATCVLHNYLRHGALDQALQEEHQGGSEEDNSAAAGNNNPCLLDLQRPRGNRASAEALGIRDTLKKYFTSPAGELPWQYSRVRRGLHGNPL